MKDIQKITERILAFRDARNWKQFNNPKDCAISLSLEASELLELFQWVDKNDLESHIQKNKKDIEKELADVLYWIVLMSHDLDIDILEALNNKMDENEGKYPVDKSKDSYAKYDKLQ